MSLKYIRDRYGVPATVGQRVVYSGSTDGIPRHGTIVGARGPYLVVEMDESEFANYYHSTWMMQYVKEDQ